MNVNYERVPTQDNLNIKQKLPNYIKKMVRNLQNKKKYGIIYNNTNNNNFNNNNFNNKTNLQNNIIPRNAIVIKGTNNINKQRSANIERNNIDEKIGFNFKRNIISKIKLDNIKSISYDSYFESNILKLLSYLKEFEINNIKIVCHSALMKKFLNQKILGVTRFEKFKGKKIDSKIKKIEKKENMWSIILNDGSICITRHAFTIANLHKEEGSKIKQFTDTDTKLSLYGILGALDFMNGKINLNNCDNTVFVSILVRTWITAICLYLPTIDTTIQNNKFKLVVSPFIKEDGITLDNQPLPLYNQIIIIKNFLIFLRNIDTSKNNEEIYINHCKKINDFFDMNGALIIYGIKKNKDGKIKYVKYQISYDNQKKCYTSTNIKENYFDQIIKISKNQSTKKCFGFGCNDKTLDINKLYILPGVRKPITEFNLTIEPLTENKVANFKNCVLNMNIGIIDINEYEEKFTDDDINNFYNKNRYFIENSNILVVCSKNSLSSGKEHFQHKLRDKIEKEETINYNFKNTNKIDSSTTFDKSGNRVRIYTKGLDNDKLKIKFYKDSGKDMYGGPRYDSILCECQYDDYKFYILHIVFTSEFDEDIILGLKRKYGIGEEKIFYTGLPKIYSGFNSGVNIIKNSTGEFYKNKIHKEGKKLKFNIEKNTNPKYTYFIKYIELENNVVKNIIVRSNLGNIEQIIQNQRSSTGSKSSNEYLSIWSNNPRNSNISISSNNRINQNLSNNL